MREPEGQLDDLARVVVDAAMEVHRELGPGYVESVYEEALAVELRLRNVDLSVSRRWPFPIKDILSERGGLICWWEGC